MKLVILLTIIALISNLFIIPASAQIPTTNYYKEYISLLNIFYQNRTTFEQSRDQLKAYKTAQSRQDTREAALKMFESGRKAMYYYTILIETELIPQEEVSSDVKARIMADIKAHQEYLVNIEATIKESVTDNQIKTMGQALVKRYGYIRFTSQQALKYIDLASLKNHINKEREIIEIFNQILAGYPDTNRSKNIVTKWVDEFVPTLTQDEVDLNQELNLLYPPATVTGNPLPYFETQSVVNPGKLNTLQAKRRQNSESFKQMLEIAKKAYQEL
ncbi:MAG: hypothetical protein M3P33_03590 [bacterium]|nr:hypothetical protein [bacterium]